MKRPIYMDNHATTPVDPRVLDVMLPYFTDKFGNAASRTHPFGWAAEEAVEYAREQIAHLIHARGKEIIFTSGATESNNLAIKGVVTFSTKPDPHVITCVTEHKAVLDACKGLEQNGKARVTYLPVDCNGLVNPDDVRRAITDHTVLLSIMYANNEIGVIHPLQEIGRIAKERGVILHCDATQAVGKIPVDVDQDGIDLLSLTAHKMYGPKGCGALYVRSQRPRVRLTPMLDGGGHERGLRSGTLNVPGIVGLGKACEVAGQEMSTESARLLALRTTLYDGLRNRLEAINLNGHPTQRLAGNLHLSFDYVEGESLLQTLQHDVALSSGSACTSATLEPSHVLMALGIGAERAQASLRFGLGRFNTAEEVDYVVGRVAEVVQRLRALSPTYAMAKASSSPQSRDAA